jgi:copper chaperone CopZ
MQKTSFNVPSLSCSVCQNKIKEEIGSMNGVDNVQFDLKTQTVNVDYNPSDTSDSDIRKKVSGMGYEVLQ